MTLAEVLYHNGNKLLIVRNPQPYRRSYYIVSMLLKEPLIITVQEDGYQRKFFNKIKVGESNTVFTDNKFGYIDTVLDLSNISSTDVPLDDLPLYVSWTHTPLFDKLMRGESV